MPSFKITHAYDGAGFSGWQAQPGQRTVQGELQRAWHAITGETIRMQVAGRTDAGVHAAGQVASVESITQLPPETLVGALNSQLPEDVVVRAVELAAEGFHATHDAVLKRYRYTIYNDSRRPLVWRRYAWHVPTPLDVAAMRCAGQALVGRHDFASFQSAGSERECTVRTIFTVEVGRAGQGAGPDAAASPARPDALSAADPNSLAELAAHDECDSLITIDVEGDGFLYNMVRTIAGTLVEVGRGRRMAESIATTIAAADRTAAGQTAPPHGLSLLWVAY